VKLGKSLRTLLVEPLRSPVPEPRKKAGAAGTPVAVGRHIESDGEHRS
jgi:hypothetical protein